MKILPHAVLRLGGLLLALLLAALVVSPSASAAATPVPLSAHITNSDGVPLAGTVCLEQVGVNSCGGTYFTDGEWSWGWNPDFNPAGDYRIQVRSSTMDGVARWYVAGDQAGTTDKSLATQVHLEAGAPALDFTMVMPAIAKVTGRAVTSAHVGIQGLTVLLNEAGMYRSTTTAADGSFDLGYTRAGSWQTIVQGGADWVTAQTGVTVPESGAVVVPDIVVAAAASVAGVVTDSVTGRPIPFVDVWAFTADTHTSLGSTKTDAEGHYRIGKLGTAPLVLRFQDGSFDGYHWTLNDGGDPGDWSPQTPITLAEGEARVYDQQLAPKASPAPPAHTLSGTVTDAEGNPLPGIDVTAGGKTDGTDRLGHWYLDAPDGAYTVSYVQNWQWSTLYGSAPGWSPEYYPNSYAASSAALVTVAGGVGPEDVDTSMSRAGRISGTLTAEGGGPAVGEHEIWVHDASGALISHQPPTGGADYSVDVPSDVALHLVARGQGTDDPPTDFLPRWYGDVDSLAASTAIQVGPLATATGKDFVLRTGLANLTAPTISGRSEVGQTLTATPGTWSVHTRTTFTTTWLRDGVPVGTGSSYLVTAADAGGSLRVRVTAANGPTAGEAFSAARTVSGLAPVVALRGKSPKRAKVRLTVVVSAPGLAPTGTLTVKRGAKVVKSGVVLVDGRAVITLKRQPAGHRRYTVSYEGSTQTLPGSGSLKVKVR